MFNRSTLIAALVLILGVSGALLLPRTAERAPNIIHIMADDLGYGELGSYGQTLIQTPNLDRLAAQGLRFTQHYAGNTLCNPSRYSLMTGLHSGSTGVTDNANNTLPEQSFGPGKLMQGAGYRTAMIGKWALGRTGTAGGPLNQGFDYFFGYSTQMKAHNYYPKSLTENRERVRLAGNQMSPQTNIASGKKTYAPDIINQRAIDFIQRNRKQAFYLQLHYNLPHFNNELLRATGNGTEHPGSGRYANTDWTAAEQGYAEMVSLIDDYVGDIIATLEELDLSRDTLVFFTSDNGPTGERGRQALQKFNATGGLKGMKGMLFEAGIRVPLIAWWPGHIEGGGVTHQVTSFWDMLPTLADLTGADAGFDSDGISFASLLRGTGNPPDHPYLYWAVKDRVAVRRGDWKWVHHPMQGDSDFLYNLAEDPGEQHNLIRQNPDKLAGLIALAAPFQSQND